MRQSQSRSRPPLAVFLIPAMALVAVLPLILRGCSCGHDFDFHLLSWFEASAQFRVGDLHPAWAFSPAFNAGEPRFVFYPPLSWTLGAILGLVIPWAAVPIVYTWLALTAAGAAMYRLAHQFSSTNAALVAAALYIANPYMLFTAYERTAYAELLATAWLPLLLAAALREDNPALREHVTILRIAIPVALLWLTNAPAAVMGCYALALIALVRLIQAWLTSRRESPQAAFKAYAVLAFRYSSGAALGLDFAAFYIIPAAYERRWVQIAMATISGMRITDNFLFHHTSDALHDQVLHTASAIAVILLVAAVAAFVGAFIHARESSKRSVLVALAILSATIAFMLAPLSAAIWRIAPEVAFLQFPWRLLAVLAPAVCVAIAVACNGLKLHGAVTALVTIGIVAALTLPAVSIFRQSCDDEDMVEARLALFNAKTGTDPTDEYTPTAADNDSLAHADPAFWLAKDPDAAAPIAAAPGPVPMHFTTTATEDETLILNLRDYPAWQIKINGVLTHSEAARADGLITIFIHSGLVHVDIAYIAGRDQRFGEAVSLTAVTAALAAGFLHRRRPTRPRVSS